MSKTQKLKQIMQYLVLSPLTQPGVEQQAQFSSSVKEVLSTNRVDIPIIPIYEQLEREALLETLKKTSISE